jgi:hypothetical protein
MPPSSGQCDRPQNSLRRIRRQNSSKLHAIVGLVAGDQAGIDGADRGADDPIGLDPRFMQRLIVARLVSAERAAALKDENDLPLLLRRRRLGMYSTAFHLARTRNVQHVFLPGCALA